VIGLPTLPDRYERSVGCLPLSFLPELIVTDQCRLLGSSPIITSCSQQFTYWLSRSASHPSLSNEVWTGFPTEPPRPAWQNGPPAVRNAFALRTCGARHLVPRCSTGLLPFDRVPYLANRRWLGQARTHNDVPIFECSTRLSSR
jgi:hypothetical protein